MMYLSAKQQQNDDDVKSVELIFVETVVIIFDWFLFQHFCQSSHVFVCTCLFIVLSYNNSNSNNKQCFKHHIIFIVEEYGTRSSMNR